MAQTLEEQVMTVERALGERMVESALLVVRAWMNELGENNPYEEAHKSIRDHYKQLFSLWLTSDDEEIAEQLGKITGDAYQLFDAVYADIRLQRGLSPTMHGFNPDSTQSIMNYFMNSVRLRPEDLEWLHTILNDEETPGKAMVAFAALSHGLRECFSIDAFLALIEGITSEEDMTACQCLVNAIQLLIHYDVRIDYFPQIQEAFLAAVADMKDQDTLINTSLSALIKVTSKSSVSEEIQDLFKMYGLEEKLDSVQAWTPKSEMEYQCGLIRAFPQTWVYEVLVEGSEARERLVVSVMLKCGYSDMLWIRPDVAEQVFREKLRKGSERPIDYIHYAHCLMLKGDRMMAFENYRQARSMCPSVKDFYALFRPDRGMLVDHGVPLEHVYLIEDMLFRG